jgi:uncharacterized phage infection (PIP) family protein YhgE
MKDWDQAVAEQHALAKNGLSAAYDHLIGLNTALMDVYAEMDSTWFFASDAITKLEQQIEALQVVATPTALPMYGRWNDIVPDARRTSDANTQKSLTAAATEREHYLDVLQLQANVWSKVAEAYQGALTRITDKANALTQHAPKSFIAKFVELETGVVKITGVDLMNSLIPALSERAAQAQSIQRSLSDTVERLRQDLAKFREGIELKDYNGPEGSLLPKYNWQTPDDLTEKRAAAVVALSDKMTQETIQTFERAAQLVEDANDIARYNERLGRWIAIFRIVAGVADLAKTIAGAGAGADRPTNFRIGEVVIPVPRQGTQMEYDFEYHQRGDSGYFLQHSVEIGPQR